MGLFLRIVFVDSTTVFKMLSGLYSHALTRIFAGVRLNGSVPCNAAFAARFAVVSAFLKPIFAIASENWFLSRYVAFCASLMA